MVMLNSTQPPATWERYPHGELIAEGTRARMMNGALEKSRRWVASGGAPVVYRGGKWIGTTREGKEYEFGMAYGLPMPGSPEPMHVYWIRAEPHP